MRGKWSVFLLMGFLGSLVLGRPSTGQDQSMDYLQVLDAGDDLLDLITEIEADSKQTPGPQAPWVEQVAKEALSINTQLEESPSEQSVNSEELSRLSAQITANYGKVMPLVGHAMNQVPGDLAGVNSCQDPSANFGDPDDAWKAVDAYRKSDELSKPRGEGRGKSFGEVIEKEVSRQLRKKMHSNLAGMDREFGLPEKNRAGVSLMSHPFCSMTKEQVTRVMGKEPTDAELKEMNQFAQRQQKLRSQSQDRQSKLKDRLEARRSAKGLFSRLMGCLAYQESLGDPNSSESNAVARQHAPAGYQKPEGVKFYYDTRQEIEASRLNIGLFQFAPQASGNVNPCIHNWNRRFPLATSRQIKTDSSKSVMIRKLGDPLQEFNAFCGVNKLVQSFYVQVNTTDPKRTHPSNLDESGKLKPPADRCVTIHFDQKAYNHFGPFQKTTDDNLDNVLKCALNKPQIGDPK